MSQLDLNGGTAMLEWFGRGTLPNSGLFVACFGWWHLAVRFHSNLNAACIQVTRKSLKSVFISLADNNNNLQVFLYLNKLTCN